MDVIICIAMCVCESTSGKGKHLAKKISKRKTSWEENAKENYKVFESLRTLTLAQRQFNLAWTNYACERERKRHIEQDTLEEMQSYRVF